jgi:hypothetical protein
MDFVGVQLHKKTITVGVVTEDRRTVSRGRFACAGEEKIRAFFVRLTPFQVVVEATAS